MGLFDSKTISKIGGVAGGPLGGLNYMMGVNNDGVGFTNPGLDPEADDLLNHLSESALKSPETMRQNYMHGISSDLPPMEEAKDFTGQALQRRAKRGMESRYNELNRAAGLQAQKDQSARMQNVSGLLKKKMGGDQAANQLAAQAYHDRTQARSQALGSLFGGLGQLGGMAMRGGAK